jgi:hypothetical protein
MDREQHDMLLEISQAFMDRTQDVGQIEISEAMSEAFGDYLSSPSAPALAFQKYFNQLQTYELDIREGNLYDGKLPEAPVVHSFGSILCWL